jgi:hypothetical protein
MRTNALRKKNTKLNRDKHKTPTARREHMQTQVSHSKIIKTD